jgi:hypothetical protein
MDALRGSRGGLAKGAPKSQRSQWRRLNTTMAIAPAFNAREIELIIQSFPNGVDRQRLKLLPKILREWAATDLPPKLSSIPTKTRLARIKRLGKVSDCARELLQALDAAERNDEQFLIIAEMVRGSRDLPERLAELTRLGTRFQEIQDFLGNLSVAAATSGKTWKRGQGQPRKTVAAVVLMDIIAIYEWLTGEKATREVDRDTSKHKGPFWQFAVTIWPLVFHQGEASLSATLRNWRDAVKQKSTGTRSPLIVNIAMRHPRWRVFATGR